METNVTKNSNQNPIPAGIISGMEGFWDEETKTKWLAIDGDIRPFDQHPTEIQNRIVTIFLNDTFSRNYLRKIGITAFTEAFDRWWKCVIGGLDSQPDFDSKGLHPDAYINTCNDMNCPDRGKLCGRESMLKNFEVETISVLEKGHSFFKSAQILCVSVPAMKKRVEKINEKLGTRNMASMIATSASFGII
jgi:hypothetical protein